MRRRRRRTARPVALAFAFALLVRSHCAEASKPVRLHVSPESTCAGVGGLSARLANRGVVVSEAATDGVDIDVRASTTPTGAEAELGMRSSAATAMRILTASTCDEVLDALVFTLALALEQPILVDIRYSAVKGPPLSSPSPAPGWGGGAGSGVFAGASPSAAPAIILHAELESRARRLFAPSVVLGAMFVLPTATTAASVGGSSTFALQTGTLDACPLRFGERFALRPCLELQIGRLQALRRGASGTRLSSSPWAALAIALRGRVELGVGIGVELDVSAGSPLIQDVFFVGDERVFGVGPWLFSAIAGLAVHFP